MELHHRLEIAQIQGFPKTRFSRDMLTRNYPGESQKEKQISGQTLSRLQILMQSVISMVLPDLERTNCWICYK
jgi:hypothetical protein